MQNVISELILNGDEAGSEEWLTIRSATSLFLPMHLPEELSMRRLARKNGFAA
jgi:hypothetical protein